MDFKPVKVSNALNNTNSYKQPTASPQQSEQVYRQSFKEFLQELLMEQREQM